MNNTKMMLAALGLMLGTTAMAQQTNTAEPQQKSESKIKMKAPAGVNVERARPAEDAAQKEAKEPKPASQPVKKEAAPAKK